MLAKVASRALGGISPKAASFLASSFINSIHFERAFRL